MSEDFLSRWSQRKAMAREGMELPDNPEVTEAAELAEVPEPAPAETADSSRPANEAPTDEAPTDDAVEPLELPPLESLDENSDYSAFLSKDVEPDLRQKALRQLFQSPKFNVRDGLDDYDLDFSKPEPLGDIVTAEMRYRIKTELERLARRELEGDAPAETAVAAAANDSAAGPDATDTDETIAEVDSQDENQDNNQDNDNEQPLTS